MLIRILNTVLTVTYFVVSQVFFSFLFLRPLFLIRVCMFSIWPAFESGFRPIGSVADPGCLSRIRLFSIPDPGSRIPDPNCLHPGSASKNLSILTLKKNKQKKLFLSSRKYDVHPGSRIRMLTFYHPGSRGQKGTGSRIRIRNTANWNLE